MSQAANYLALPASLCVTTIAHVQSTCQLWETDGNRTRQGTGPQPVATTALPRPPYVKLLFLRRELNPCPPLRTAATPTQHTKEVSQE